MQDQHQLQKKLLDLISSKVKWGDVEEWKHSHYEHLVVLIQEETGVLLSSRTLKRFFKSINADGQYSPQIETKNALCRFVGFNNWLSFMSESNSIKAEQINNDQEEKDSKKPNRNANIRTILLFTFAIFLISVTIFVVKSKKSKTEDTLKYRLESDKNIGTIPFIVKFKHNYDNSLPLLINYGVMAGIDFEVTDSSSIYTYKKSGVFPVKLKNGNSIKKEILILAQSKDWEPTITTTDNYYPAKFHKKDGHTFFPETELIQLGKDINLKRYWTRLSKYYNFGLKFQDIAITVKSRIDSSNYENICPDMRVALYSDVHSEFMINFVPSGCSEYFKILNGSEHLNGNKNDYSFMAVNPRKWNEYKYLFTNDSVKVFINDEHKLTLPNHIRDSNLFGIHLVGKGNLEVDFVNINSINGDTIYHESFN